MDIKTEKIMRKIYIISYIILVFLGVYFFITNWYFLNKFGTLWQFIVAFAVLFAIPPFFYNFVWKPGKK